MEGWMDGRTDGEGTVEERYKGLPSPLCSALLLFLPIRKGMPQKCPMQAGSERGLRPCSSAAAPPKEGEGSVRAQMTSAVYGESHNLNEVPQAL